ncbi:MAG: hypothetical protein ACFFES_14655 [Candidatus Thorarchaeota archaeon]
MSEILAEIGRLLTSGREFFVGAVEITQFPEEYFVDKNEDRPHKPFYNILRALTLSNIPGALRYQRVDNNTRILYITWTTELIQLPNNIQTLTDAIKATLPDFKFKTHSRFNGPSTDSRMVYVLSHLVGEPLTIEDPQQNGDLMTAVAEVLQGMSDAIIQISFTPKTPSDRARKSLENKYRQAMAQAQMTVSSPQSTLFSGEIQQSVTKVDSRAAQEAESIQKKIKRLSHSHVCDTEVTIISWELTKKIAENMAGRLMTVLRGNLIPADKRNDFRTMTKKVKPQQVPKLLKGIPIGKSTIMSLEEACVFLPLPKCDVGISVSDHAAFRSNPANLHPRTGSKIDGDVIRIGKIVDDTGREISDFGIPVIDLASHTGLTGDTGRGKTTTQLNILLQLQERKINFLVLLASKSEEYVKLTRVLDSLWIFTLGDETVAPLRFSFTAYGRGVHVSSIINDTKAAFVAMMPTHGMIKEYLEALIELTFERLGWNRDTNTRGIPILLSDFLETLPQMEDDIQYSSRGNEDFRGALYGRLRTICKGALSRVFGTISGISIEELVSRPSVILLDKLSKEERAFFVYWLVSNLGRHFEAKKKLDSMHEKGLKFYVVLEEAHRFLSGGKGLKEDEDHAAQNVAIDTITVSMRESRSAGLGFSIATQKPLHLNNEAITMALTNIVHATGPKSERQLLGDLMNCTDEQIRMMGALPVGEAVVRTASASKPVRVRIDNPFQKHPRLSDDTPVTDEDIRQRMQSVFEENPHFQRKSSLAMSTPKLNELGGRLVSIDMLDVFKLHLILNHSTFNGALSAMIDATKSGNPVIGGVIIRGIAKQLAEKGPGLLFYCQYILWILSQEARVKEDIVEEWDGYLWRDDILPENIDLIYQRLYNEVSHRIKSVTVDEDALGKEIRSIVKSSIEEFNELAKKRVEEKSSFRRPETEDELDLFIKAIVRTEQFASRYYDRLRKAVNGDTTPIARMIRVFSKKAAGDNHNLELVATKMLQHAKTILGTPENEELWNTIVESVNIEIRSQGSEVVV